MAEELDGCGHNVVVRNGKEGGLRVHRNVPYEFSITLPRYDVSHLRKHFDIFPFDWGMLRRSRCVQILL